MTFDGKTDGLGAELVQIVYAMAHSARCNASFCGVDRWATVSHGVHIMSSMHKLFGDKYLLLSRPTMLRMIPSCAGDCPNKSVAFCHVSGFLNFRFDAILEFTHDFVYALQAMMLPGLLPYSTAFNVSALKAGIHVAMHVRRGDVRQNVSTSSHADPHVNRYVPDSYYLDMAKTIREIYPMAKFHVWTDSQNVVAFRAYESIGIRVHFQGNVLEAMAHFSMATIFVMAVSSFSFLPALLNANCVVYHPNPAPGRQGGISISSLPSWIHSDSHGLKDEIRTCVQGARRSKVR